LTLLTKFQSENGEQEGKGKGREKGKKDRWLPARHPRPAVRELSEAAGVRNQRIYYTLPAPSVFSRRRSTSSCIAPQDKKEKKGEEFREFRSAHSSSCACSNSRTPRWFRRKRNRRGKRKGGKKGKRVCATIFRAATVGWIDYLVCLAHRCRPAAGKGERRKRGKEEKKKKKGLCLEYALSQRFDGTGPRRELLTGAIPLEIGMERRSLPSPLCLRSIWLGGKGGEEEGEGRGKRGSETI